MLRYLVLCASFCAALFAQFDGLATTQDGAAVYFVSALRFKETTQPLHGKLFVADRDGVRLVRSREMEPFTPQTPNCSLGNYYRYTDSVDVAGDGSVVAARVSADVFGTCGFPVFSSGTNLLAPGADRVLPGLVRLSPNGRFGLVYNAVSTRFPPRGTFSFLDVLAGTVTPIELPVLDFPRYADPPYQHRLIADDGTALIRFNEGFWIVRPGRPLETFPVASARPIAMDANASVVLYTLSVTSEWRIRNLRSGEDRTLLPAGFPADESSFCMSDDGRRVIFLRNQQLYAMETSGGDPRPLTSDPLGVLSIALSGNGRVVYAATGDARLVRIDADSGAQTEVIGRTPFLGTLVGNQFGAGTAYVFLARGLAREPLTGVPPLQPWLGDLTMWIEERKVPVIAVTPTLVHFLVPWDIRGRVRVRAEAPARNSPFDWPEGVLFLADGPLPTAGAVVHQDWRGLVNGDSPARPGEIVHIYAVGLGAVNPEVAPGVRAPQAEPLSRTTQPFVCRNGTVRYAGLAPGLVERWYQVDLQIGSETGLVRFSCSLGGGPEVVFAQFFVAP